MARQTVDYGIDLGTTNSAIARALPRGVKIVKNRNQNDTTPSVVAETTTGQIIVGDDARNKPELAPAFQFKRLMGTSHITRLANGRAMLPEELSAEILKELKASVQALYDEEPEYVVITVPAMFLQPQCESTNRAAELAGLHAVTLLQEPIAAATAYLNEDPEEGNYLVFDLGGGTFDVSIVRLRDSQMSVVAHGGDNYLGGADFDRCVFEWVREQLEKKVGSLPQLDQPKGRYQLLRACEEAKKRLSQRSTDESIIDLSDMQLGLSHVRLTRVVFEDLTYKLVERTIRLTQERLIQAKLTPNDIKRVLLVGGGTIVLSVRDALKSELGIPISLDQDAMTVVAAGAAIYASTLRIPKAAEISVASRGSRIADLELHYEPVSPDEYATVSGRVTQPSDFQGEIRFARKAGDWETGWVRLDRGTFLCDLLLPSDGRATEFLISLRDSRGTMCPVSEESITLRFGIAVATPVTPYKYGVAIAGGEFHAIIDENVPLPAYGIYTDFRTTKALRAGTHDEIPIYFLEGNNSVAKYNIKVGELRIRGTDVTRSLREGEKVTVSLRMDESRLLKARVSIPILDLDFPVEMDKVIKETELQVTLEDTTETLSQIERVVADEDTTAIRSAQRDLEQIEADLEDFEQGEKERKYKVSHRLMTLNADLDLLKKKYSTVVAHQVAIREIDRAEKIAREMNSYVDLNALGDMHKEAEKALRTDRERDLRAIEQRASAIFWKHYRTKPECWIGLIAYLRSRRSLADNLIAYDDYLARAEGCLDRNDWEGVRVNGIQAMEYLPNSESMQNPYSDAAIRI